MVIAPMYKFVKIYLEYILNLKNETRIELFAFLMFP